MSLQVPSRSAIRVDEKKIVTFCWNELNGASRDQRKIVVYYCYIWNNNILTFAVLFIYNVATSGLF